MLLRLVPEDAKLHCAFDRRIQRSRKGNANDSSSVPRIDDTVVPQSGRGKECIGLFVNLLLEHGFHHSQLHLIDVHPRFAAAPRLTISNTPASCSPPMTAIL